MTVPGFCNTVDIILKQLFIKGEQTSRGKGLTYGEGKILPYMTYERVEVIDSEGKRAWLSPIPVNR